MRSWRRLLFIVVAASTLMPHGVARASGERCDGLVCARIIGKGVEQDHITGWFTVPVVWERCFHTKMYVLWNGTVITESSEAYACPGNYVESTKALVVPARVRRGAAPAPIGAGSAGLALISPAGFAPEVARALRGELLQDLEAAARLHFPELAAEILAGRASAVPPGGLPEDIDQWRTPVWEWDAPSDAHVTGDVDDPDGLAERLQARLCPPGAGGQGLRALLDTSPEARRLAALLERLPPTPVAEVVAEDGVTVPTPTRQMWLRLHLENRLSELLGGSSIRVQPQTPRLPAAAPLLRGLARIPSARLQRAAHRLLLRPEDPRLPAK